MSVFIIYMYRNMNVDGSLVIKIVGVGWPSGPMSSIDIDLGEINSNSMHNTFQKCLTYNQKAINHSDNICAMTISMDKSCHAGCYCIFQNS